jgi:aspartyl-tRNA synthetase
MTVEQLEMNGPALVTERKRSHMCGVLREHDVGQEVVLMGWVQGYRDLGGAVFLDLRDREGIVQVVFDASSHREAHAIADRARLEWVVGVVGTVRSRGDNRNDKLPTGAIEVEGSYIQVFNRSETPPFPIEDGVETAEDKRLQYRYLDLRRPEMQRKLLLRSKVNHVTRQHLYEEGFKELETPYMVKYTPGGARNFIVPSRLNPGSFYALAESPQLYKQLFMMSGFDRYFQITKCFRDEDLRLDRQPEFTQIDLEMSFAAAEDVREVMERLVRRLFQETLSVTWDDPFPVLSYDECMRRFGSDKPDLRYGLEHTDLTDIVREKGAGGMALFEQVLEAAGIIKAMVVPGHHKLSRSDVEKLEPEAKSVGASGLGRAKIGEGGEWTQSPFAKMISDPLRSAINEACNVSPGDFVLFQMGPAKLVHTVMNHLRGILGKRLGLIRQGTFAPLWVVDFPLFEVDDRKGTLVALHHPFTSPKLDDVVLLAQDPGRCRAQAYDLVLNGYEVAGGSVRIHRPDVQAKVFEVLGISETEQRAKFGFLLDALAFGAPPHAGIAAGVDRLTMLMAGASSIRDMIPFPKTQRGSDMMTGAPTAVASEQLNELGIRVEAKEATSRP